MQNKTVYPTRNSYLASKKQESDGSPQPSGNPIALVKSQNPIALRNQPVTPAPARMSPSGRLEGAISPEEMKPSGGFFDRLGAFAKKSSASQSPPGTEITGQVESVRMFGDDWGVATLISVEHGVTRVTGNVSGLAEGSEYIVSGVEKKHPKYGKSLDLISSRPHVQLNAAAMVKYIKKNFKGIGDVSAKKYIASVESSGGNQALEVLRQQLVNEPWTVDFSSIDKKGSFEGDEMDETLAAFIQRDLSTKLVGLGANVINPLAKYLLMRVKSEVATDPKAKKDQNIDPVGHAWAILRANPYLPIKMVPGYGFASADNIGKVTGVPNDAPIRLAALCAHAIEDRCSNYGHTYITLVQAKESIRKMDPRIDPDFAIQYALTANTVISDDEFDEVRIYPKNLANAEIKLAKIIADFCSPVSPIVPAAQHSKLREKIQVTAKSLGGAFKNGLDESQENAIFGVLTAKTRLHSITAGPGCGKTAVMEVLAKLLPKEKFLFCAPTGKGAKVLNNRVRNVGSSASTIHSMLRGDPDGGFIFNESNRLETDQLVMDESSMPGLELACATLAAVDDEAHVIVLGDQDQLGSIEPGSFLSDILKISQIDHHRLSVTHRNSGGIRDVVEEIKAGDVRPVDREGVIFSESLPSAEQGFHAVMSEYLMAVNRSGFEGTALIMSRRKGEINVPGWNTTYANEVLRQVCNPNAQRLPGSTLCVNDRIIIKQNITFQNSDGEDVRVVNGDTGTLTGFEQDKSNKRNAGVSTAKLKLDDGRLIDFPGNFLKSIDLSYAFTVHAGQGSEYKDVILVVTPGQPTFINRNMLYTGASRARTRLSFHANPIELIKVAATPMPQRNSGLVQRVAQCMSEDQESKDSETTPRRESDRVPF